GVYTNFLKLLPIVSNADVTIKQDQSGGIEVQTATDPEAIHYTETEPFVYERVDDTTSLLDKAGMDTSQIQFKLDEQGHVTKMTYGIVSDFLPVNTKDRVDVNTVIMIVSILTFIVSSILAFIQWFIRKRKHNPTPHR